MKKLSLTFFGNINKRHVIISAKEVSKKNQSYNYATLWLHPNDFVQLGHLLFAHMGISPIKEDECLILDLSKIKIKKEKIKKMEN